MIKKTASIKGQQLYDLPVEMHKVKHVFLDGQPVENFRILIELPQSPVADGLEIMAESEPDIITEKKKALEEAPKVNRVILIVRCLDYRYGFNKGQDYEIEVSYNTVRDRMSGLNVYLSSIEEFFTLFKVLDTRPQQVPNPPFPLL